MFDGHGPTVPAPGASEGLTVWAHPPRLAGAWSVGGLAEGANNLLVQETVDGTVVPVLDNVFGVNLTGTWQVLDRVGLAATVPVWLTATGVDGPVGPGGGDAWAWVPVDVVRRDAVSGNGLGFGVRPGFGLPTGAGGRFLGASSASASLALNATAGVGPLLVALDAGVLGQALDDLGVAQQVGGLRRTTDALLGVEVGPALVALEGRSSAPLGRAVTSAADRPTELTLSVRGRFGSGAWAGISFGRGITRGIGAPGVRVLAGGGWQHDPASGAAAAPEAVDRVALRVNDPEGKGVPGAEIRAGTKVLATTGADGTASVKPPRGGAVVVSAPGLGSVDAKLEAGEVTLSLPWTPRPVPIRVQDQAGRVVDTPYTVTPVGGVGLPPVKGTGTPNLLPGRWELAFTPPGSGEQRRIVQVDPRTPPTPVEVVLLPDAGPGGIAMALTDAEGVPVVGARVLLDGQPVGVSGANGDVWVKGLAVGTHQLSVRSDGFTEQPIEGIIVTAEAAPLAVPVSLERVAGSVRVTVRAQDGTPASDAVLRFSGPRRLAPTPVGDRGERLQVLGAGTWSLLVTSTAYGVQERAVVVPEDSWSLIQVDVVLQPDELGASDVRVRVVDPDGAPMDRAELTLDGEVVGLTSTGGEVVLRGLDAGPRALGVQGAFYRPSSAKVVLVDGYQEAVLTADWLAGATRVVVRTPTAPVGDATIRPSGPTEVAARTAGPDGVEMLTLGVGDWTVLVTSPAAGLFDAGVTVAADDRRLHRVDALMLPEEGGEAELELTVLDPDGAPVRGARVSLDGELVGTTGDTGVSIDALTTGKRQLRVEAPPFHGRVERPLTLAPGANRQTVSLTWAESTAEIQVVDSAGTPVKDAVLRLAGPVSVPPTPVDAAGERKLVLVPGSWQVLATSSSLGFAESEFTMTGAERLAPVRVVLEPVTSGRAGLLVRVQDPDGNPIPEAVVTVGETRAVAGATGAAVLELDIGPTDVSVSAPGFAPDAFTVQLADATERIAILKWLPLSLEVAVVDASGNPVDAEIRLVGPEDRPMVRTGPDGGETLSLRPGAWQVIAATDALGPTLADVKLAKTAEKVKLVLESSKVEVSGAAVAMKEQVRFEFDRATLQSDSESVLRQVANTLVGRSSIIRVEVQGHTDDKGTVVYNQELSQKRAESVVAALIALGVPPEKLVAVGYGMQRPLVPNDSEANRAANRRVVFAISGGATPTAP